MIIERKPSETLSHALQRLVAGHRSVYSDGGTLYLLNRLADHLDAELSELKALLTEYGKASVSVDGLHRACCIAAHKVDGPARTALGELADAIDSGRSGRRVCRACGAALRSENERIADGCPCNSQRGINHGLVPKETCTCVVCDPEQTGSTRYPVEPAPRPEVETAEDFYNCLAALHLNSGVSRRDCVDYVRKRDEAIRSDERRKQIEQARELSTNNPEVDTLLEESKEVLRDPRPTDHEHYVLTLVRLLTLSTLALEQQAATVARVNAVLKRSRMIGADGPDDSWSHWWANEIRAALEKA